MKHLYIILTRSSSFVSSLIYHFTADEYTHASLSFSDNLQPMYSFGRIVGSLPYPAGFKEEPLDRGFYKRFSNSKMGVYRLEVSDEAYQKVYDYTQRMAEHKIFWRYSTLGLLFCKMNISVKRKHHYFCSQFVAEALEQSDEIDIKKDPTLYHPIDFLQIDGLECVYKGTVTDFVGKELELSTKLA